MLPQNKPNQQACCPPIPHRCVANMVVLQRLSLLPRSKPRHTQEGGSSFIAFYERVPFRRVAKHEVSLWCIFIFCSPYGRHVEQRSLARGSWQKPYMSAKVYDCPPGTGARPQFCAKQTACITSVTCHQDMSRYKDALKIR
eukprot:908865-Pelagomonas_calceolata.AAC.6